MKNKINLVNTVEPTQCVLWEKPELVKGVLENNFKLIKTYTKDSHFWRYFLSCRECGQLYFFEFYEEIDWVNGNDPQYSTWIPIASSKDGEVLSQYSVWEILACFPRIQSDFPANETSPKVWWNRKD